MSTLDDALSWIDEHAGQRVNLEIRAADPADGHDVDVLGQYVELRGWRMGDGEYGEDARRGIAAVEFNGDRDLLYLDPARVTEVKVMPGLVSVTLDGRVHVVLGA